MRILYLNTWQEKHWDAVANYISAATSASIMCLQEVKETMVDDYLRLLPMGWRYHYAKRDLESNGWHGNLTLFDSLSVTIPRMYNEIKRSTEFNSGPTLIQYGDVRCADSRIFSLFNVQGITWPSDKLDSPDRAAFTAFLIGEINATSHAALVGGDFNVDEKAHCLRRFVEEAGMTNLLAASNEHDTRGPLCFEHYHGREGVTYQPSADQFFARGFSHCEVSVAHGSRISDHEPCWVSLTI